MELTKHLERKDGDGLIAQDVRKDHVRKMVDDLMADDELLKEFNFLMRQKKIGKNTKETKMIFRSKKKQLKIDNSINQISIKRDLGIKKYGIESDFFQDFLETSKNISYIY